MSHCADSEAVSEKHHCTSTPDSSPASSGLPPYLKSLFGTPTHPIPWTRTLNVKPLVLHSEFKSEKPKLCPETTKYSSFPSTFCIYTGKMLQSSSEEKANISASRVKFQRAAIVSSENKYARAQEDDFPQITSQVKSQHQEQYANLTDVVKHLQAHVWLFCLFMCLYISLFFMCWIGKTELCFSQTWEVLHVTARYFQGVNYHQSGKHTFEQPSFLSNPVSLCLQLLYFP